MAEESIDNWTRGDLYGEWTLSDKDVELVLGLNRTYEVGMLQIMEELYSGNDAMSVSMTKKDALIFNASYRKRQLHRMKSLPWDQNLLDAFHNLHFILYMTDKTPDFSSIECEGQSYRKMDIPGRDLWVYQLVMKAATDCLRDDYLKVAKASRDSTDYRIDVTMRRDQDALLVVHIAGDCIYYLTVGFQPIVKKDGTFGCTYKVSLGCSTGPYYHLLPPTGKPASNGPLSKNMFAMKRYIEGEMKRFSKMLDKADFNQPEYALKRLNSDDAK